MEHSSKWNPHIIKMEHSSKMEHSHQKCNTPIIKRNTGEKVEQKCNTPIIKRNTGEKVESMNRLWSCFGFLFWNGTNSKYSSWNENTHIKRIVGNLRHPHKGTLHLWPSYFLLRNETLIISMRWIIVKSLGSSFNDLLKTYLPLKTIFTNINVSFLGLKDHPPFQTLDFGLFSAVWLPLEPTIDFSNWSTVSPTKSRDFRLPEPAIPFYPWSAVSHSKSRDFRLPEPAIPFDLWSAVLSPPSP